MKGRHFIEKRSHSDIAVSYFQKALEIDPNYALAYSGLAYSYFYQVYFNNQTPSVFLYKAREEAQKAMSIDRDIPEPHILEGIVTFYYDRNIKGALIHYERAIELNPKAPDIYRVMAYYYSMIRKFNKALGHIEKAIDIDPLDLNIQLSFGEILYRCKNFDKTIQVLTTFTRSHPDSMIAWIILANAHFFNGDVKAFREIFSRIDDYSKPVSFYLFTAYSNLAELGEKQKVEDFLVHLENQKTETWISSTSIALLHLALENDEKAEYFLKLAIEEKDPVIMVINADPSFSKHQKHPLIQATLKKIGLREA